MANVQFTQYGIIVELDHSEITQIANYINTGAAATTTVSSFLAMRGIGSAAIAAIVGSLFWLGSAWLIACNSRQQGIYLHILWVGVPWCVSR